ncbi:hypothetical protein ACH4GE_18925 [Streptomyces tendae]|uniref:hypothetical protein n=1 Tax=Streptomyces TaxID=1883 RepID=UPI0037A58A77
MKPTAQRRRDRRDLLDNLLSRALRGNLTTAEAALLAESVREEQRVADQTRRSLGETGTAYGKHRAAADDAIRELEQRALDAEEQLTAYRSVLGPRPLDRIRDAEQARADAEERARKAARAADLLAGSHGLAEAAEERLTRIRDMADAWESRLPATIRTATAAEAVRRAANGDDRPVMFAVTPAPADDQAAEESQQVWARRVEADLRHARDRVNTAEEQAKLHARAAEQADAVTAETKRLMERRTTTLRQRAERAEESRDRFEAAWQSARQRASVHAQHAERLKQSNKRWYGRAAEQIRRAKRAETALDEQRQALATALRAREDHEWPALIDWAAQAHEWATRAASRPTASASRSLSTNAP